MALMVLVATGAGCLSPSTDSSKIHTYQLSLDGWLSEARSGKSDGPVLLVSPPQAEPGFETQRMVYVKRPYELEYYAMNQWADTPVRMFAPLMVQALNQQNDAWRAVIPLPSPIRGDYRLDTHGFLLQQEFFERPSRVRVMVRTQLIDLKESTILSMRAFEVVENAASENPYGGVQAANRAIAGLLDQMSSWLQQCVRHSPECRR
ncbi:MAG TPA: ABC-type transport auxiliary lipoprotein family protein [Nitrospira sp.]|nr:ABC-type transport auxiliary lipoprotein family protein [Nitrospira sp.]